MGNLGQTRPPRCRSCYYDLSGFGEIGSDSEGTCPECGTHFFLESEPGFTTKPPLIFWKLWLPGFVTAALFGIAAFAYFRNTTFTGSGVWVGVPVAMGCIIGYRFRVKAWMKVLGILAIVPCVILTLVTLHIAGILCGLTLSGVILGPLAGGLLAGAAVRAILKEAGWSQASHLPALLFMLIPFVWAGIEGPVPARYASVAVTTQGVIAGTPEQVWRSLQFYEEVGHTPPILMKLTLPTPLRVSGSMDEIGDERVCHYTAGKLTKRITSLIPGEQLTFDVVEQEFEPNAELLSGSFVLEPIGTTHTRLILTTEYRPLLGPRLLWQPGETLTVRTLHRHVLEGIRLDVENDLEETHGRLAFDLANTPTLAEFRPTHDTRNGN